MKQPISNWSGSVRFSPGEIARPGTEEEVSALIRCARNSGQTIRTVGSAHSFTPLVETDSILVSLERMEGVEEVDFDRKLASVRAGSTLKTLGNTFLHQGWSFENLGDINAQSIAGAVSTGTHGTGVRLGCLSEQVESLTLVPADGISIHCSAERNAELFQAARVSLGSLGILTRIQLRVKPLYRLRYESRRLPLGSVMEKLEEHKANNRHFEFYWFPYTNTVQAKFLNPTESPASGKGWWSSFNKLALENGAFWILSEAARLVPRLCPAVSRISARGVPRFEEIGDSQSLFVTPRLVRFNEMEYGLPAEALPSVLEEMKASIQHHRFPVHFPVEIRFVKGDDIWLSPAYEQNSAFVAVHMYKGMPHRDYFAAMERIFLRYGGRPHWGKIHSLEAKDLARLYPRWEDFLRVRRKLDPEGLFLNPYLRRIFGVE
ncbi:FAD-linked oxidoreductase [Melghirimyces profundicolus]|uniref:FAD-linked oxidoreductase n=1 Tax=Melghirimyces profundicolus TaxID=1242148 RepID=A0A2T6BCW1_9BACL|nr:D-arabinono-1,4-lactone oxidase [Melghirimyces profundicolus]PTX53884.1 FAD-linked oxidoreductase [Melghirimyces profundicolus]